MIGAEIITDLDAMHAITTGNQRIGTCVVRQRAYHGKGLYIETLQKLLDPRLVWLDHSITSFLLSGHVNLDGRLEGTTQVAGLISKRLIGSKLGQRLDSALWTSTHLIHKSIQIRKTRVRLATCKHHGESQDSSAQNRTHLFIPLSL